MEELFVKIKEFGIGEIVIIVGRYYVMDCDKRWECVEIVFKGFVFGEGEESIDLVKIIKECYDKGENDEFFKFIIVGG